MQSPWRLLPAFLALPGLALTGASTGEAAPQGSFGGELRVFRIALIATGEYTRTVGGRDSAVSRLRGAMREVSAIFERDLAVRLELVGVHAFEDPAADPYLHPQTGPLLMRNTTVADSLFGDAGYDLAQVVSYQASVVYTGLAACPSVCGTTNKGANAIATRDLAVNDRFVELMAHEIGHQFGALHIQDAQCQRHETNGFEPGSGSTIMSRGGGFCEPWSVQGYSNTYFHGISIEQMRMVAESVSCGRSLPSGNRPPTVEAGPDRVVPRDTPFRLLGAGLDADGDRLLYCWEQVDRSPESADSLRGPLVRSRPPVPSAVRLVPGEVAVFSSVADRWERLSLADRTLRFRLTARDGRGGVVWDETVVEVRGEPFKVLSPAGGEQVEAGGAFDARWQVGGGSVAGRVNLHLSSDGGATWALLARGTTNDGIHRIHAPKGATHRRCRLRVEAENGSFYDVSDADFSIVDRARPSVFDSLTLFPTPAGAVLRIVPRRPPSSVSVERRTAEGLWSPLAGVVRESSGVYIACDSSVAWNQWAAYRVMPVENGKELAPEVIARPMPDRVAEVSIDPVQGPVQGSFRVEFAVHRAGRYRLALLDLEEREVQVLDEAERVPGRHRVDFVPVRGRRGIHVIRLEGEGASATRQVSLAP